MPGPRQQGPPLRSGDARRQKTGSGSSNLSARCARAVNTCSGERLSSPLQALALLLLLRLPHRSVVLCLAADLTNLRCQRAFRPLKLELSVRWWKIEAETWAPQWGVAGAAAGSAGGISEVREVLAARCTSSEVSAAVPTRCHAMPWSQFGAGDALVASRCLRSPSPV